MQRDPMEHTIILLSWFEHIIKHTSHPRTVQLLSPTVQSGRKSH